MKNLTLIICLDDGGGMTFLGKRQSRDRVLLSEMFDSFSAPIYVLPYSTSILGEHEGRYISSDAPIKDAPEGGVVFLERGSIAAVIDEVETLVIYRWNRRYPKDAAIDIDLDAWRVLESREFVGSSHDKITKLVMKRR